MDNIRTKELTEMKDYINSLSDKYHAKYTNQVRGIMWNIKAKGNLTNEELGFILGIPETKVESMLHETWDGHVSTKLIIKLQLLSCGMFGLPGCQMRVEEIDTIDDLFDNILCPTLDFCDDEPEQANDEPDVAIFNTLLSIFDDDSEFQETMWKKYGEYKELGSKILREVEEKYRSTKKTVETAQKVAKASKDLNEAAKNVLNKIGNTVGNISKSDQKCEPKFESKTETKVEGVTATIDINKNNDGLVSGKAYYVDDKGDLQPISIDGALKMFSELIDKMVK